MLATYGLQRSNAVAQVVDPYFASVKLLLHFDGGQGSTYFQDLSPSPLLGTVSAGPTITSANPRFGIGCGNFANAGYISYNDVNRFAPSASEDFTIECWFNTTSAASLRNIASVYEQTIGRLGWMIRMSDGSSSNGAGNKIALNSSVYGGSETYVSSTTSINDGNWHFLQIVRQSGVLKLRLDGIEEATTSFANAYTAVTDLRIGYQGANQGNNWVGQIDEFRFTRGIARPNIVPTAAFPNKASGWLNDSSANNRTVISTGSVTQADLQNNVQVAAFDGSTGYLNTSATNNGFDLSSGNSTIEFFFKPIDASYRNILYSLSSIAVHMYTDGKLWINNGIAEDAKITVTLNTWQHVAIVFLSGLKYVYVNGTLVSTTSQFFNATSSLIIGYNPSVPNFYNSFLAGLRIVKGTAVYTSNFSVPRNLPTAITGTQLLMNFGATAAPTV
jgi:hypothetical protein